MIRIYGVTRSRAFRSLWMLEELGLRYEELPIGFDTGETREPGFLAINPNGHIPVLVDGETVVWESLAINHYLASRYGGGLAPEGTREQGEALRWSFWAMAELEGPIDSVAKRGVVLPDDWCDPCLGVLDAALAERRWLLGDRFTVADLNVAVMFWRPVLARAGLEPRPHVRRWLDACKKRPALLKLTPA